MSQSGPAETQGSAGRPEVTEAGDESSERSVDLQALAERLYRLLKEEARLERERMGRRRP
jgi:hypothetical protein